MKINQTSYPNTAVLYFPPKNRVLHVLLSACNLPISTIRLQHTNQLSFSWLIKDSIPTVPMLFGGG